MPPPIWRFGPNARISPSSAAVAPCRAARCAGSTPATGEVVLDALLATLDGHIVLRTRVIGSDPLEVGAAARDLLDGKGGRAVLDIESIG